MNPITYLDNKIFAVAESLSQYYQKKSGKTNYMLARHFDIGSSVSMATMGSCLVGAIASSAQTFNVLGAFFTGLVGLGSALKTIDFYKLAQKEEKLEELALEELSSGVKSPSFLYFSMFSLNFLRL